MATNYPGSLDTSTQQPSPSASTEMDDAGYEHDAVHTNHSGAIIALETKLGTGDSNAVANSVLAGTGSGTSAWTTGTLANDISGNAATATSATSATTATNLSGGSVAATTITVSSNVTIDGDLTGTSNTNFTSRTIRAKRFFSKSPATRFTSRQTARSVATSRRAATSFRMPTALMTLVRHRLSGSTLI